MTALTKGMFGQQFDPQSPDYGIRCGQMRADDFFHNAGWYNAAGEKLGWGDLSKEDVHRLMRELPEDERFIILSEADSFWNFSRKVGLPPTAQLDIDAPGVDYIFETARYVITNGHFYSVRRYESDEVSYERDGLVHEYIDVDKLRILLQG